MRMTDSKKQSEESVLVTSSSHGQISQQSMTPELARKVIEEVKRRKKAASKVELLQNHLFPKQKELVNQEEPIAVAQCGRRSGKTESMAVWLLLGAFSKPYVTCCYASMSKSSAVSNIWHIFQKLDRTYDLEIKFNNKDHEIILKNGSNIMLGGVEKYNEREKFRGKAFLRIVLDEIGSFRAYARSFWEEVLQPTLLDHRGRVIFASTPPEVPSGLFYDYCHDPNIPTFKWNSMDNPHIPHAEQWLEKEILEKRGWSWDTPAFRREYLGEWTYNTSNLAYSYDEERNTTATVPEGFTNRILGIDVGYRDATGFVLLAYDDHNPEVVVLEAETFENMYPSAMAEKIDEYQQRHDIERIIIDSTGIGKGYQEEIRMRYGIHTEAAEKMKKITYVRHLSEAFSTGKIKFVKNHCEELIDEVVQLRWEEGREKLVDGNDHLCDALLYAWRACKGFLFQEKAYKPKVYTDEWFEMQDEKSIEVEERIYGEHTIEDLFDEEDYSDDF